jgi:hypothetical protein
MSFQHALAMMGGIITPPILVSGASYDRFFNEETRVLLSLSLCLSLLSHCKFPSIPVSVYLCLSLAPSLLLASNTLAWIYEQAGIKASPQYPPEHANK